ncbi:hypothetical protein BC835DRAFT_100332 [Cytidiella melzeri]|nr:hypothetical protein BC835DRAFT_100332 [Cytidiella melzeri]
MRASRPAESAERYTNAKNIQSSAAYHGYPVHPRPLSRRTQRWMQCVIRHPLPTWSVTRVRRLMILTNVRVSMTYHRLLSCSGSPHSQRQCAQAVGRLLSAAESLEGAVQRSWRYWWLAVTIAVRMSSTWVLVECSPLKSVNSSDGKTWSSRW